MATCLVLQLPFPPPIPSLPSFGPPAINFPPAIPIGIPCCRFTIPGSWINISLAPALAPFLADIQAANVAIAATNAAIQQWITNFSSNFTIPTCPLNGKTL